MSKKKQKKQSKNKSIPKALLDTSVQFERVKFPDFENELNKLNGKFQLLASYFSLHEYKTSLIASAIDYYHYVELTEDISKAIMKWSDKRGRDPKYHLILEGMMHRINRTIQTQDIEKYLRQLEIVIIALLEIYKSKIAGFVGDFAGDEIVKFNIEDKTTYLAFDDLLKRKRIISMESFWKRNSIALDLLLNSKSVKDNLPKMYGQLKLVRNKYSEVDRLIRVNAGIGDAVIAVDCPQKYTLITTDESFESLCPPLNKKLITLSKIT